MELDKLDINIVEMDINITPIDMTDFRGFPDVEISPINITLDHINLDDCR